MTRRSKSEEAALDFALYDLKSMIVYDTDACDNQRAVRVTKLSVRNDRAIYIYIYSSLIEHCYRPYSANPLSVVMLSQIVALLLH